jgi:hypothetical protein
LGVSIPEPELEVCGPVQAPPAVLFGPDSVLRELVLDVEILLPTQVMMPVI